MKSFVQCGAIIVSCSIRICWVWVLSAFVFTCSYRLSISSILHNIYWCLISESMETYLSLLIYIQNLAFTKHRRYWKATASLFGELPVLLLFSLYVPLLYLFFWWWWGGWDMWKVLNYLVNMICEMYLQLNWTHCDDIFDHSLSVYLHS